MALRVGISSKGFYSRIERGLDQPSVRVALALEEATGVDAATFCDVIAAARGKDPAPAQAA